MQTNDERTFSVVVPLFNEEENVGPLVEKIMRSVGTQPGFAGIVLVDDGSLDQTATIATRMAEVDERIRLVRHENNRGLGAAIRTGLNASDTDFVLYTDADLPFDFELIPDLISQADDNSVIAGCRLNRGEGARRWVLTKGYNFLIWLLFGLYIADVNFACKVFPRRFLRQARFASDGSFIDVEILLEAQRRELTIVEYPMTYFPRERGLSTLSRPAVIVNIFREMVGYASNLLNSRPSLLTFLGVSPLVKFGAFFVMAMTALILNLSGIGYTETLGWLLLTLEFSLASVFFGWRIGLAAAAVAVVEMESWLLWQSHTFLSQQNYQFLVWAMMGVLFSQLGSGSWKLLQRSLRVSTSEWAKD